MQNHTNSTEYIATVWPPPYKLRFSTRAKHTNLKIHPITGLEITVPTRSKNFDIDQLLTEKRSWLEKHWTMITAAAANTNRRIELPTHIFIPADKSLWRVVYYRTVAKSATMLALEQRRGYYRGLKLTVNKHARLLVFTGNPDLARVQKSLISWLKQYANDILTLKLQQISLATGLGYNKVAIRSQSTVWGSCNHAKHISLNMKLLFLPTALTKYVLLHELCHTKYLNHGRRFWQLVHKFMPDYTVLERYLKHGDKYLPAWLANISTLLY